MGTPVSILRHIELSPYSDRGLTKPSMDAKVMETPLSESSVSLKLEEIQKRCNELMDEPEALLELSIEEPVTDPRSSDPYNR